jgi:hypothetical protein
MLKQNANRASLHRQVLECAGRAPVLLSPFSVAVLRRVDSTAEGGQRRRRFGSRVSPRESGVALRLPPHSKTLRVVHSPFSILHPRIFILSLVGSPVVP